MTQSLRESSIVFLVNEVAYVQHHTVALRDGDIMGVTTLEGLYQAFQERHAQRRTCMEGFGGRTGALRWKYAPEGNELYHHSRGGRVNVSADQEEMSLWAQAGSPSHPKQCLGFSVGRELVLNYMEVDLIWDRPDRVDPLFRLLETMPSLQHRWHELLGREPELRTLQELVHMHRRVEQSARLREWMGWRFKLAHDRAQSMSA